MNEPSIWFLYSHLSLMLFVIVENHLPKISKNNQILIFSGQESPRLHYVVSIIFKQLLGLDFQFTQSSTIFIKAQLPKINYSNHKFNTFAINIYASKLLFERKIHQQDVDVEHISKLPLFFGKDFSRTRIQVDFFSVCFYLLSRYEEYLPFAADEHGRFAARRSLAARHDFLQLPVVNLWAMYLAKLLKYHFPNISIKIPQYESKITYDIDMAWAFRKRNFVRMLGASARDLLSDTFVFRKRLNTFLRKQTDPFYTFPYIFEQHKKRNLAAHFFFLLGNYSKYDKNIAPESDAMKNLILEVFQKFEVGIHPSYESNNSKKQLQKESATLSNIIAQEVQSSRQHFLKLRFPKTYQNLLEIGIQSDFTMGYADAIGFRASIANPYPWFDLEKNEATDLMIYPFQVMDVSLKNYLQLNPQQAIAEIEKLIKICQEVGGCFIPIWHNSSLSELDGWLPWREVYESMLKMLE